MLHISIHNIKTYLYKVQYKEISKTGPAQHHHNDRNTCIIWLALLTLLISTCLCIYTRHNIGYVTPSQLHRCLSYLELPATDEEVAVISLRFSDANGFNYLKVHVYTLLLIACTSACLSLIFILVSCRASTSHSFC